MCVVAFLYWVADAGIAAWLNDIQAIYVFPGVYYPKVTLLILITLATVTAYGLGLGHDMSTGIVRQARQGKSLGSRIASYRQARSVKTRFRWKEPLPFKYLDPSYRPLTYRRIVIRLLLISTMITGLIWVSHFVSQGLVFTYHLLLVPLASTVMIALFVMLPLILIDRTPAELTMNLRGIERKIYDGTKTQVEVWLWAEIADCVLADTVIHEQKLRILKIVLTSEESVILGLSTKLQQEQLQHFFERIGKTLTIKATVEP